MSEEYQRFVATAVIDTHETQIMIQLSSPTIPKLSPIAWDTFTDSIINQKSLGPSHSLMTYWNSYTISLSDTARCYKHTEWEKKCYLKCQFAHTGVRPHLYSSSI